MPVSNSEPAEAPAQNTTTEPGPQKARVRVSRKPSKPVARVSTGRKKPKASAPRSGTKTAKILRLLGRPDGASVRELMRATQWQPHSVRGFLSGAVKGKMRLKLASLKRDNGERAYRVPTK